MSTIAGGNASVSLLGVLLALEELMHLLRRVRYGLLAALLLPGTIGAQRPSVEAAASVTMRPYVFVSQKGDTVPA